MKRILSLLLALMLALSTLISAGFTLSADETEDSSALPSQVVTVTADYTYHLDDAVTVRKVSYISAQGQKQTVAILRMPIGDYGLYVGTPGNDLDNDGKNSKTGESGERIDDMAGDAARSGVDVLAGVNGDFYKTGDDGGTLYSDYALLGTLKKNGVELSDGQMELGSTYLGVTYAGELVMGDVRESWLDRKDSLYNAFGGEMWLVKDGINNFDALSWRTDSGILVSRYGASKSSLSEHPRTAIGFNDSEVIITVFEGRGLDGAVGVDLGELCDFMTELGCTQAMNLDGGGSTALVGENRADSLRFDLLAGSMRKVGEAILVTKKQTLDFLRELYHRSLGSFDQTDPAYTEDSFLLYPDAMAAAEAALQTGASDEAIESGYAALVTALLRITRLDDAVFTLTEEGSTDTGMRFLRKLFLVGDATVEISTDGEHWTAPALAYAGESGSFFYPDCSARYVKLTGEGTLYGFGDPIDFTELRRLVAYSETLDLLLYTDATATAYRTALEYAVSLLDSDTATSEDVASAADALRAAQDQLVMITDKVALAALISQCEALDLTLYSGKSAGFFTQVLNDAKAVYSNPLVSQADVDTVLATLTMAKTELKAPVNIAYKMDVDANCNPDNAAKITDGTKNTSNYWASQNGSTNVPAAQASFVIDFDGLYTLDRVTVYPYWNGNRVYQYEVYGTTDGESWVKIAENRSTDPATDQGFTHFIESGVTASAIKIQGVSTSVPGRSDINNMHIIEVEAFGDEANNIALDKPVTSSGSDGSASSSSGGYDRRITDGDRTSYWDAGLYSNKPWAIIDLEGIYRLDSVNVIAYWMRTDNRYYTYDVYLSVDGTDYEKVWSKTSTAPETVKGTTVSFFSGFYARYIKIVGLYDSANTSFHVNEVRAYGEKVDYDVILAKKELQKAYNRCNAYDPALYTADSYALLRDAMERCAVILADPTVVLGDLQEASEMLEAIERLLEPAPRVYNIKDVTKLLALLANESEDLSYDFSGDGFLSIEDVTVLLSVIANNGGLIA